MLYTRHDVISGNPTIDGVADAPRVVAKGLVVWTDVKSALHQEGGEVVIEFLVGCWISVYRSCNSKSTENRAKCADTRECRHHGGKTFLHHSGQYRASVSWTHNITGIVTNPR